MFFKPRALSPTVICAYALACSLPCAALAQPSLTPGIDAAEGGEAPAIALHTGVASAREPVVHVPEALKALLSPHDVVQRRFETGIRGLDGYLVYLNANYESPAIIYALEGGKTLIAGGALRLDAQTGRLENLSSRFVIRERHPGDREQLQALAQVRADATAAAVPSELPAQTPTENLSTPSVQGALPPKQSTSPHVPQPVGNLLSQDAAQAQALFSQIESATYITDGPQNVAPKTVVYGFFDPNCIYCHLAWKLARPYVAGGLEIRWLPVSVVAEDSAQKAAWILAAKDPTKAFNDGEAHWAAGLRDGGGRFGQQPLDEGTKRVLLHNFDLFREAGLTGTPGFVYRDRFGAIRAFSGVGNSYVFSDMTGLPYIPVTDGELVLSIPK